MSSLGEKRGKRENGGRESRSCCLGALSLKEKGRETDRR